MLGYHGCDEKVAARLLNGEAFAASENDYDWLGPGIYFWEANPLRGIEYAQESSSRRNSKIKRPSVVGAVIDLGRCLDLSTSFGITLVQRGYESLKELHKTSSTVLPKNSEDKLRRRLDCAVIGRVHEILQENKQAPFDTVRGVFTEGRPAYESAAFNEKTHIQIAVRSPDVIKGVFRVPKHHLIFPVR